VVVLAHPDCDPDFDRGVHRLLVAHLYLTPPTPNYLGVTP